MVAKFSGQYLVAMQLDPVVTVCVRCCGIFDFLNFIYCLDLFLHTVEDFPFRLTNTSFDTSLSVVFWQEQMLPYLN